MSDFTHTNEQEFHYMNGCVCALPFWFEISTLRLLVTPIDGSKTWGRTAVCKKEDLSASKKKGRTWGPSSTHQKERVGGEEKYVDEFVALNHYYYYIF